MVNNLICWWTPLHLLKGQQLALVDLLEPIGDGGVELRLRAFLPLEHAHGGRVVVVVVVFCGFVILIHKISARNFALPLLAHLLPKKFLIDSRL